MKHALVLVLVLASCGGEARFAVRGPATREIDTPLARAPRKHAEDSYENFADAVFLRPLTRFFLFETGGEARDVTSLDEVPDSSWFQNRTPSAEEIARGACTGDAPLPPFVVERSKNTGVTPGLFVRDARGDRYLLKVDELGPRQPEISTAADAIVSRLYWAVGFNVPCNLVLALGPNDVRVGPRSTEQLRTGERRPLTTARLETTLSHATRTPDGLRRIGASRIIEGTDLGTWPTEGVRPDDANDVVAHEDRRELRGERFLAAWVAHWDSRGPNTHDSFVDRRVEHYFLDFSDALGGNTDTRDPEPRLGFTTIASFDQIFEDALTFGLVPRPWDAVKLDARWPDLGYLDVAHFEPLAFYAHTPLVRWNRAQSGDLAWMARKLARLDEADVRAAVKSGKLTHEDEEVQLVRILMGRREKILRAAFARASPLADVRVALGDWICASDLEIESGLATAASVRYDAPSEELPQGGACARAAGTEYQMIEFVRHAPSGETRLRVHVARVSGRFVIVGLERP